MESYVSGTAYALSRQTHHQRLFFSIGEWRACPRPHSWLSTKPQDGRSDRSPGQVCPVFRGRYRCDRTVPGLPHLPDGRREGSCSEVLRAMTSLLKPILKVCFLYL